jgi:chromosome segregation ATPase
VNLPDPNPRAETITRYDMWNPDDGALVLYSDHASAIAALRSDVARLEGERDDLTLRLGMSNRALDTAENQIRENDLSFASFREERDALAAKLAESEREIAEYAEQSDYADDAFRGMGKMKDAAQARVAALEAALRRIERALDGGKGEGT